MKCSKCGNEVKGDAKFCNICGQKLDIQNTIDNDQNSQQYSENNSKNNQPQVNLNKDEENKKEFITKQSQVKPPKKKNRTLIAVIGVVAVVLVAVFLASMGSSETEKVSTVKDGYFYDYTEEDGYTDVGTAFDNYFADGTWEAFTADDDSEIVEFNGTCYYLDEEANCSIQFEIEEDNTFNVRSMEIDGVPQSRLIINSLIEEVMEESWDN